jgi:hypothetical protein
MSIYDDPRMQLPEQDDFPDDVKFHNRNDRIFAKVMRIEELTTRHGLAVKYWLWDFDTGVQKTMLSGPTGAKDLWRQLLEKRPEVGDDMTIVLLDNKATANGTFKEFDVQVTRAAQPQAAPAPVPVAPAPPRPQPAPAQAPAPVQAPRPQPVPVAASYPAPVPQAPPAPAYQDEDAEDLFGR